MIFQDLNNITDVYNKDGSVIERIYNRASDIIWEKSIFDIYDVTTDPYYTQYFTITPTNGSTISIRLFGNIETLYLKPLNAVDSEWYHSTSSVWKTETNAPVIFKQTLNNWERPVQFRINRVSGSGTYDISGNILSLVYGDDFIGQDDIRNFGDENGSGLFAIFPSDYSGKLINAENLILAATKLRNRSYMEMFKNCYYLQTAPKILPAMELKNHVYHEMFYGCIALKKAPILPALTLVQHCYTDLFNRCSSLNWVKALYTNVPAVDIGNYNNRWLSGVSETGTFIKNKSSELPYWCYDIPDGWTIISE